MLLISCRQQNPHSSSHPKLVVKSGESQLGNRNIDIWVDLLLEPFEISFEAFRTGD